MPPTPAPDEPPRKTIPEPNSTLVVVVALVKRLRRYWDDLIAWPLLAFAVITVFGLLDLSSGTFLDAWADALATWFGWGAVIVPLTAGWIGVTLLARNFGRATPIRWGRVIAIEGAAFALLGIFNLIAGRSVAAAAAGEGGGLIGWGIGNFLELFLPVPLVALVLGVVFLGGLFLASNVAGTRLERILDWLQISSASLPMEHGEFADEPTHSAALPTAKPTNALLTRSKSKLAADEKIRVLVDSSTAKDAKRKPDKKRDRRLPGLEMLDGSDLRRPAQKDIDEAASIIVKTLKEFGIPVKVIGAKVGPSVTQYQVEPGFVDKPGPDGMSKQYKIRIAQISSLSSDLALALSATSLRIEAPVPGHSYVGIEVPNRRTSTVSLRPVLESENFQRLNSPLSIALGRDVSGAPVSADLGRMPHLLIAGTTGSGKSVCISAIITCLAVNNTPEDLRLVLIDPKMVELVRFNGLPHLFGRVEMDLDRVTGVLRWVVREMDRRYKLFEGVAARNLDAYIVKTSKKPNAERLPRLVVVIDELADLMMRAPDETERTVVRLAQMARATGIHLVVATQRPSTDIVTGLIKANFPARISFAVASGVDSRVILDGPGAESLLGRGDMLFLSPEAGSPVRLQGCYVSDKEIDRLAAFWKEQMGDDLPPPPPIETAPENSDKFRKAAVVPPLKDSAPWEEMLAREAVIEDKDQQIEEAIQIVQKYGNASASLLQRKMRIGYPRAARLMDELKEMGIIGRERTGGKTREVFVRDGEDPIGDRAMQRHDEDGGYDIEEDENE